MDCSTNSVVAAWAILHINSKMLLMSPAKKKRKKNQKQDKADQKKPNNSPQSYEDLSPAIDAELRKRKGSWFLSSVAWLDFDDVSQIIRAHIFRKWGQWDQSRPLKPWLNKIIANQFKNILRNHYSNFARPCLNCPFNSDTQYNLCSFTGSGTQDNTCPLYAKWEKTKKHAYNVKITLSLESHAHEILGGGYDPFVGLNIEEGAQRLIKELKSALNARQFQAFELLYVKNMTDEEAAQEMGFKSTESGRKAGYKQIKNLKKLLKEKAEKILKEKGIAFLGEDDEPE
jgi:DNA-directed RNA polymerase specialized sigma24 family protein